MVTKRIILFLFFITFIYSNDTICYFTPPNGWKTADPTTYPSYVKIGFIGEQDKFFRPSINLAVEEIEISEKEYLNAVKKLHKQNIQSQFQKIGTIQTKAGKAHLFEDTVKTKYGETKILQSIFVSKDRAYILTGSTLKDKYLEGYKVLLSSFRSLFLTEDLFSSISNEVEKNTLKTAFDQVTEKEFKSFQTLVEKKHENMGLYWQILVLERAYKKALAQKAS